MELIYKGKGNLSSRKIQFKADCSDSYEVADADGRYLLKTFPKEFEEVKQVAPKKAPAKKTTGKDKKED